MLIIWIFTMLHIFIGYITKYYFIENTYVTLSFILISSILFFFILIKKYTNFFIILYSSFVLRLTLLFIDLKVNNLTLPHSGDDTENFYKTGIMISNNLNMLNETVYGGLYSKLLGLFFNIYGDDRFFIQFLNIIIGMTALIILIKIFKTLNIPNKTQYILIAIASFFPHLLIFSSILLRESIISLLVILSLYYFVKWFQYNKFKNSILSVTFILIASLFHSAVIGILLGYLFGFIFYKYSKKKIQFNTYTLLPFVIFSISIIYIIVFPEVLLSLPVLNKFTSTLENSGDIYQIFINDRGGSAYLTGIEVTNIFQLILYSPLKMFYFLLSPMPWDIRSFGDLIGFMFDSSFYLVSIIIFLKNFKKIKSNPLSIMLIISLISAVLIFGVGVSNAGTALRHRFKLFYLVILILSSIFIKKNEKV